MGVARSIVALALVAILVGACGRGTGAGPAVTAANPPAATSTASVVPSAWPSPLPGGGISGAEAVELARGHSTLVTLLSASVGHFRDLCVDPKTCLGFAIKPEQRVWAVTFAGDAALCHPIMGPCAPPAPAVTVVYLDYVTGDFLGARGYSLVR